MRDRSALDALARNVAEVLARHQEAARAAVEYAIDQLAGLSKLERAEKFRRRIRFIGGPG